MIWCSSRCLTVLMVTALCLESCGDAEAHTRTDHDQDVPDPGVFYHKKHLEHAKGQLISTDEDVPIGWDEINLGDNNDQNQEIILHEEPTFKPVRVDKFKVTASTADSYHDVLRLFLGERLSDEAIDNYMASLQDSRHAMSLQAVGIKNISPEDWNRWMVTQSDTHLRGQCSTPVAELVRIRDLTHRGDMEYVPDCVLVYRCRIDSGCCPNGLQCGPKNSVNITKSILVGTRRIDQMITGLEVQHFSIPNDTECHCVEMPTLKERPCPYPFNHSLHECRCIKESLQDYCGRIAKGREPLAAPAIKCIHTGNCRPLDSSVCENFMIEEGRCPAKPRRHKNTKGHGSRAGGPSHT